MAYQQLIVFTSCCENAQFVFLSVPVSGLPSDYYVYTGTSTITGTYLSGVAGYDQLIPGQCYFIEYYGLPTIPWGTTTFSSTGLTSSDFDNSATYFPDPESGCDTSYCINQCSLSIPTPILNNTVTFSPCCNPGESIIFIDTSPFLFGGSPSLVNGATYLYNYLPGVIGQALGPLGIEILVPEECYTLTFGTSTTVYPTLPSGITISTFFTTGNSCLFPACVAACNPIDPEPSNNRYLQYVPCCTNSGPTLYFRLPTNNSPIDGVASYVGTISSNPYPTTDVNCNSTTSLVSNKCYSITLHSVGVGEPVSTVTQYNCLALAPENISGNYIYYSPTSPGYYNSSCQTYINTCPDCNPLCFTLWSCDGSQPLFTTSTNLTAFVGLHITVSSVDPEDNIVDLCVFVQNTTQFNCTNAIEVVVTANSCICDCTCWTVTGNIKSIEYIDCFGDYVLIPNSGVSTSTFCAQTYPIVFSRDGTTPTTITNNGDCIESTFFDPKSCEEISEYICTPPICYLLEDCTDNTNVIYSNSPSLTLPANLGQVVTILGHTECWKILIPQECICPVNVTVLTTSSCCEACLPNINYKLTACNDNLTYVYTSDDLSLYVDKVVRREDCPEDCWIVSEIDGDIPTDLSITVIEDYLNCELCYRKYYLLEDCLGLQNDIITYTDLSDYVDKVITLDWCPETCWEVSETIEDDSAGVISDVLNSYNECIDCLTNAPCICSTIKNYNDVTLEYKYLDCYGILQSIVLEPGQKSDRLCLIRWYAPELCNELIITYANSYYFIYQNSFNHPGPVLVNDKPTWKDAGYTTYVYYDGTKWILSKNNTPLVLPPVYTPIGFINCNGDCDCPTGTWQQSSSIPNQDVYVTTEFKYTIEYFGNCINGVCPPIKNKQKSVTPGYNTPGCEAWKYEEISCRAADAMYKQVLELRYGISNCCPEEDVQYIVQKELIDLAALYDPAYPCATNSCGCNNDCNCSTAEPVCPPIPLTYNCFCTQSACECIEIGNGSGEYSTLALCQTSCVPIPVTYNCVNNNCTNPGDGSGEYFTLEACEEECQPVTTYNCTNGSCVPVSGPLGEFPTLQDCENDCQPVTTYNCVDGDCVPISGPNGEYPTLLACEEECVPTPVTTYDCIDGECVEVQGSGGQFSTYKNCYDSLVITNNSCADKVYTGVTVINPVNTYDWLTINYPNNNFDNYTFSCNNCPGFSNPCLCPSPDNECLVYCSFVTVVNPSLLFIAYTANDLINYLNTNYPSCGPFLLSDTVAEINSILSACPESENVVINIAVDECTCDTACEQVPRTSYNCVDDSCIDPGDGTGEYPTLLECEDNCIPPTSYNCINCLCNSVTGSGGQFPTLGDCVESGCNDVFITTWETTTAGESITLPYLNPITGSNYTGIIDWGDSTTSVNSYVNRIHLYSTPGTYTVTICGTIEGWEFSSETAGRLQIKTVERWGQLRGRTNLRPDFYNCSNLNINLVQDTIDLTGYSSLVQMFQGCSSLTSINNINSWNTSSITDMVNMFALCSLFNQALSFVTSAVQNMAGLFQFCTNFTQPFTFNTSTVSNMSSMFWGATNFNQPLVQGVNGWDTSSVTNMCGMFAGATAFNQNIGSWDVSNVTSNFDCGSTFMAGKTPLTFSTTNLDALLCGWSSQIVNPNLQISFGTANYTNATGLACKNILTGAPNLWIINSGGGV
jgi:surface protein